MFEVLGEIILFILSVGAVVLTVLAGGAIAVAAGFVAAGLACIGWFPLVICIFSSKYEIGIDFTGVLAQLALYLYTGLSVVIIILAFIIKDPDKIPPGFKYLALFYSHPTKGMDILADRRAFAFAATRPIKNPIRMRMEAREMRKETERTEADAERAAAAADRLAAEEDLRRAKAREEAIRRRRK